MNYAVLICPFSVPVMGHYISKTDLLRCPRPCATLSTAVINVVHGRGQRAEPVFATDFPLEAMERRGEEADNSVPSSSFGHLRASNAGAG